MQYIPPMQSSVNAPTGNKVEKRNGCANIRTGIVDLAEDLVQLGRLAVVVRRDPGDALAGCHGKVRDHGDAEDRGREAVASATACMFGGKWGLAHKAAGYVLTPTRMSPALFPAAHTSTMREVVSAPNKRGSTYRWKRRARFSTRNETKNMPARPIVKRAKTVHRAVMPLLCAPMNWYSISGVYRSADAS